jgi:hypothetical protein
MRERQMRIIKLADSENFIDIIEGRKHYYGGNQRWFDFTAGKYGGCGTVAAADIAAYMAKYHPGFRKLYNYSIERITKPEFTAHMNEVYKYVTPKKFPFVDRNTPPIKIGKFLFGWSFGIWPLGPFVRGFERFAFSRGIKLKAFLGSGRISKEKAVEFIGEALKKNIPLALLIGLTTIENCRVISPDGNWNQNLSRHWVTITELREDSITGITSIRVSTWGGYCYLNLNELLSGKNLFGGFVYFQQTR